MRKKRKDKIAKPRKYESDLLELLEKHPSPWDFDFVMSAIRDANHKIVDESLMMYGHREVEMRGICAAVNIAALSLKATQR